MNIIISQSNGQKTAQLTQWNSNSVYDINNIKIYIQEGLAVPTTFQLSYTDMSIELPNEKIYTANIEAKENLNINNYLGYSINPNYAFPNHTYECSIIFDDNSQVDLESALSINNNFLNDEHTALRVEKRSIITTGNENLLVAQDSKSQQITFEIKECYDGISFLDDTKFIYVDFIPVGYKPTDDNQPAFYSSPIIEREGFIKNEEQWLRLKWNVPFLATKTAGTITIALAVTDNAGYVWQTTPTTLTVQKNIGLRPIIPVEPSDDITAAEAFSDRLLTLEDFMANIDNVQYINEEKGTITHITRETNTPTTTSTVSVVDLFAAGSEIDEVILSGGSIDEEVEE